MRLEKRLPLMQPLKHTSNAKLMYTLLNASSLNIADCIGQNNKI